VRPDDTFFTRDVNLWQEGYIDSSGALELIAFVEREYRINLTEEALFDPAFTNVRGISQLVCGLVAGAERQAAGVPAVGDRASSPAVRGDGVQTSVLVLGGVRPAQHPSLRG
jgi:acyl carrier protein